jgi:glutathione reductase (NADPH)
LGYKKRRQENRVCNLKLIKQIHLVGIRRVGEKYSGYKVLIEEDTERILGAHILGQHAEEVINIFAMAIRLGIKAGDIKQTIFAYPTNSSDISYML